MIAKAYTIALLSAVLTGSTNAGHNKHHSHSKRANTCGSKGYDRGQGNYFYDNGGKFNSYAACSAACVADTKCKSFGYSNEECMLFNIPLSGNFDADQGSSDVYYDLACLSAAKSLPSSSSSMSSPASKTSSIVPAGKASSTSKSSTPTASSSSSTSKSSSKPSGPANTPSSLTSKTSTAAVVTTPSSAGGATGTSSTAAPTVDFPTGNPYETKGCPMPTALAISNFKSTIDSTGWNNGSVKIQYGNGTFSCPGRCSGQDGYLNCICDPNGMLQMYSDGRSFISIQQAYWCDAQPQRANKAYESLALTLNFTTLADYLTCDKKTNTCTQSRPILAPVGGYGGGPLIGFSPIDINGNSLPNCPERPGHSPIVTNTATCTGA